MTTQSKPYDVPISRLSEHIGDKLMELMENKSLTIAQLARSTGLTRMGIYKILYGSIHVRVDTLERIGKVFGVGPGLFLEGYESGDGGE